MKVLAVASNIYNPRYTEFSKTRCGYGYMVNDIVTSTSKLEDVYLLTHQFTPGISDNKYTILPHTKFDVVKSLTLHDIIDGLKAFFLLEGSLNSRLRYLYYEIEKGFFRKCIKSLNPDVVHIHGLTRQLKPYVEVCIEKKIPFLVTLHGLNGEVEKVSKPDKEYERAGLELLDKYHVTVTVVSTGVKDDIRRIYGLSGDNIVVILNGTEMRNEDFIHKKHSGYNIICIGNISSRKNQLQLIRAYRLLPDDFQKKTTIHLCGGNPEGLDIDYEIRKCSYPDNVIYHGYVERSELDILWQEADLNVVASIIEGFGLSIIEGFSRGIPTLSFSDISACNDLFNENAMMTVNDRSDESLANALVTALDKRWDRNSILEWAEKFSMDSIAIQYSTVYKRIRK